MQKQAYMCVYLNTHSHNKEILCEEGRHNDLGQGWEIQFSLHLFCTS